MVQLKRLMIFCLAFVLVAACSSMARAGDEGRVVKVLDGDSIIVKVDRGRLEVRIWGIDCPEYGQPFSDKARSLTRKLTRGQPIRLVPKDMDRHCRLVARVITPEGDVALSLLEAGLAWWYERFAPNETAYEQAHQAARREGRGLWSAKNPVPPWQWKRKKRN